MTNIVILLFIIFSLCITRIDSTHTYFRDVSNVLSSEYETKVVVDFYLREDNHAVGFKLNGVSEYENVNYIILYKDSGGLEEAIVGSINNSAGDSEIIREWLILGTCSSLGEVCVYDDVDGEIKLDINLVNSGIIEKTLQEILNI